MTKRIPYVDEHGELRDTHHHEDMRFVVPGNLHEYLPDPMSDPFGLTSDLPPVLQVVSSWLGLSYDVVPESVTIDTKNKGTQFASSHFGLSGKLERNGPLVRFPEIPYFTLRGLPLDALNTCARRWPVLEAQRALSSDTPGDRDLYETVERDHALYQCDRTERGPIVSTLATLRVPQRQHPEALRGEFQTRLLANRLRIQEVLLNPNPHPDPEQHRAEFRRALAHYALFLTAVLFAWLRPQVAQRAESIQEQTL